MMCAVLACVRCPALVASDQRVCAACGALQPVSLRRQLVLSQGSVIERGYGRYVIDTELGAGAMGTVYRVWLFYDPHGPRAAEPPLALALKVLRSELGDQERVLRDFFTAEAEALRRLDHPNVVRFHELFSLHTTEALTMEFVRGDTVEAVLERHAARARGGPAGMDPARAWFYFQQLLGALAATHRMGIVHRDIKPSNVLVRQDGVVKLTDFGIAEMMRRDGEGAHDPTRMVPGTGPYMSPEQVQALPLDGRSDLYSAAIMFFEMLTGRSPYDLEGKSEWMIRVGHVQEPPHPLRAFLPHAPPSLEAVFARAFAKHPADRFADAIELGEALRLAMGMPDAPEWRAYAEIADHAAQFRGATQALPPGGHVRLGTLRALVLNKLRTAPIAVAR